MNKWKQLTNELQKKSGKKGKAEDFKDYLHSPHLINAMMNLCSPLNPALQIKRLL